MARQLLRVAAIMTEPSRAPSPQPAFLPERCIAGIRAGCQGGSATWQGQEDWPYVLAAILSFLLLVVAFVSIAVCVNRRKRRLAPSAGPAKKAERPIPGEHVTGAKFTFVIQPDGDHGVGFKLQEQAPPARSAINGILKTPLSPPLSGLVQPVMAEGVLCARQLETQVDMACHSQDSAAEAEPKELM